MGRGKDCLIPRSNERYHEEFSVWARIKNRMIVYTDPQNEEAIRTIRRNYDLEDRTKLIVIEDLFSIEPQIYRRMREIESDERFLRFRALPNAMSNNAKFDYAWLIKYFCLADAAKFVAKDSLLAWFDFGFNHKDACFTNPDEFSFLWDCTLQNDKIHLFVRSDPKRFLPIESLQFMQDVFLGVFHVVPAFLAGRFWQEMRNAMEALLSLGCIDDDQQLLFMAFERDPTIFQIHRSDWFLSLKESGASHLTAKEPQRKKKNLKSKLLFFYMALKHAKRAFVAFYRNRLF